MIRVISIFGACVYAVIIVTTGQNALPQRLERYLDEAVKLDAAQRSALLAGSPVATLLGWNTRTSEFGGPDLCDLLGSTVPLARTRAEAAVAADPRPSLEELYGTHDAYVAKVAEAARKLQAQRLMLPEDVESIIREAEASSVLR